LASFPLSLLVIEERHGEEINLLNMKGEEGGKGEDCLFVDIAFPLIDLMDILPILLFL